MAINATQLAASFKAKLDPIDVDNGSVDNDAALLALAEGIAENVNPELGGGGGSTTLSGLSDVSIASLVNGQILVYNSGAGEWENVTPNYLTSVSWGDVGGTLADQTDLQTALNGKEPAFNKNTAFNKNFGTVAGTVVEGSQLANYQLLSEKGQANGYTPLNGSAKISETYLPDSVLGQVEYQGAWNANTNTPTLPDPTTVKGHYYVTDTAGTFSTIDFEVGDWVISNGVEWQKVDNSDAVTTVFGRMGNVVANQSDYASFYMAIDATTDDVSEGASNLYFTNARSRGAISVSGDLSYDSGTGVISFSETYSTATELLNAIKTVDGSGSGLDADTLDGLNSSSLAKISAVSTNVGFLYMQRFSTGNNSTLLINQTGTGRIASFFNGTTNSTSGSSQVDITNSGGITATGAITASSYNVSSDKRLKKHISEYTTSDIASLQAVWYEKDGKKQLGYYGQHAIKILPESVNVSETDKFKDEHSVNYIMVHTAKIAELEAKVARLERLLNG